MDKAKFYQDITITIVLYEEDFDLIYKTLDKVVSKAKTKTDIGTLIGTAIAERALKNKVKKVVFDRNGYPYHGRVKAVADAAREAGLEF